MPVYQFNVGDTVQSTYRGQWVGVVLDRLKRKDTTPLYTVRAVLDRNGHPVDKHVRSQVRRLDERWLRPYKPKSSEEARLIEVWSDPTSGRSSLEQMNLRTATLRLAASLPKGNGLRSELLWQVIATELVDVDKFGGNESYRRAEAVKAIATLVRDGKKPIWVVDMGGALKDYRDFHKELVEDVSGYFLEAAAYASEAQEHEEEGTLMGLHEKWSRTRFRIQPVVSPRTKKPGYKVTW